MKMKSKAYAKLMRVNKRTGEPEDFDEHECNSYPIEFCPECGRFFISLPDGCCEEFDIREVIDNSPKSEGEDLN
jgi:hypothetical protein